MPLEGIFFFGILIGWPNLAELYKEAGIYESVCDKYVTNVTQRVTINCPESQGDTDRKNPSFVPTQILFRESLLKEMFYFPLLERLVASHIIAWHYHWDLFWINMEHSKPVR